MAFDRNHADLIIRSTRDDGNLDFPFLPLYRQINYITLDSSTTILVDGYFDNFRGLKVGDLIHIVIVDHFVPAERLITPVYLLVQVSDIDPVVKVMQILNTDSGGGGGPGYTGDFIISGSTFLVSNGRIMTITPP